MQRTDRTRAQLLAVALFVLVGGWPGSGKSTLARALASELRLPLLVKDEMKETLFDGLGQPQTVEESQRLGRVAVLTLLRVAQRCPGAVLDSTWFDYTRPLLAALPGTLVEVRCIVPVELARSRYQARAATRPGGPRHRTHLRRTVGTAGAAAGGGATGRGGHLQAGRRARRGPRHYGSSDNCPRRLLKARRGQAAPSAERLTGRSVASQPG